MKWGGGEKRGSWGRRRCSRRFRCCSPLGSPTSKAAAVHEMQIATGSNTASSRSSASAQRPALPFVLRSDATQILDVHFRACAPFRTTLRLPWPIDTDFREKGNLEKFVEEMRSQKGPPLVFRDTWRESRKMCSVQPMQQLSCTRRDQHLSRNALKNLMHPDSPDSRNHRCTDETASAQLDSALDHQIGFDVLHRNLRRPNTCFAYLYQAWSRHHKRPSRTRP